MKTLKVVLVLVSVVILLALNVISAQDKKDLDKEPKPVGGIETIMKNVVYPSDAKKENIQGKVIVKAIIDEKGDVVHTEILKGDNKLLNQASEKAVKATKFTPGEKDGKKVKAEVVVPIKFKLH